MTSFVIIQPLSSTSLVFSYIISLILYELRAVEVRNYLFLSLKILFCLPVAEGCLIILKLINKHILYFANSRILIN